MQVWKTLLIKQKKTRAVDESCNFLFQGGKTLCANGAIREQGEARRKLKTIARK